MAILFFTLAILAAVGLIGYYFFQKKGKKNAKAIAVPETQSPAKTEPLSEEPEKEFKQEFAPEPKREDFPGTEPLESQSNDEDKDNNEF